MKKRPRRQTRYNGRQHWRKGNFSLEFMGVMLSEFMLLILDFQSIYISSGNERIIELAPQITGGWIHAYFVAFDAFLNLMERK